MDRRLLIVPLFALAGGCVNDKETDILVSPNPFAGPAQVTRAQTSFPQANVEIASRVDQLGRKIIAANPQIGLRPLFCAIGSQNEEIFHQGGSKVIVTEGLVAKCKTDVELAAVLCRELGKMVAEREALASPAMRTSGQRPPIQVEIGRDVGGNMRTDDGTELVELARYEKRGGKPCAVAARPQRSRPHLPEEGGISASCAGRSGYRSSATPTRIPPGKSR